MNRKIEASGGVATLATGEVRAGDNVCSVHLISGSTPNVVLEVSNDNANWVSVQGVAPGYAGVGAAALTGANTMLVYMIQAQYWRIRNTAGTAVVVATFGEGWVK